MDKSFVLNSNGILSVLRTQGLALVRVATA